MDNSHELGAVVSEHRSMPFFPLISFVMTSFLGIFIAFLVSFLVVVLFSLLLLQGVLGIDPATSRPVMLGAGLLMFGAGTYFLSRKSIQTNLLLLRRKVVVYEQGIGLRKLNGDFETLPWSQTRIEFTRYKRTKRIVACRISSTNGRVVFEIANSDLSIPGILNVNGFWNASRLYAHLEKMTK